MHPLHLKGWKANTQNKRFQDVYFIILESGYLDRYLSTLVSRYVYAHRYCRCLSVYLFIYLSIYISIYHSIYSIYSIYISICLDILIHISNGCLFINLPRPSTELNCLQPRGTHPSFFLRRCLVRHGCDE